MPSITKINIDGQDYDLGGGSEVKKLTKYVRPTPDTEEGTSAQFGIFNNDHQTYIQIDSNKIQSNNEYIDNINIDNSGIADLNQNAKPNININAKSMNINAWDFLLNTHYGKICLDSDNKMIRIGDSPQEENENINVLTLGRIASYCLRNNNVLLIGKNYGTQYVNNSMIITDSNNYGYIDLENSIIVGEDLKAYGPSVIMIGKGLKNTPTDEGQQIIFGQYNKANEFSVFQIGDGQGKDATHNLFQINNDGRAFLSLNGDTSGSGPGYVIMAPEEKDTNSCWPFQVLTSQGYIPVRLTYEKRNTTTTSSFEVVANNSVINSIKLTSDEDGTKTVTLSDPDAWKKALSIDSTNNYFRRTGSVNTSGTWRGLTLYKFPAKGTWVIIFRAYTSRTDLGSSYYFHQQIKIADEVLYEGTPAKNTHVMYNSDNVFGIATVTYECTTTSTKLECFVSKSGGDQINMFYDVTGFRISQ